MGVVGDLEDQPGERLVGARLADDFRTPLGVSADNGGFVEWAGEVGGDAIQEALNADELEGRAAKDRLRATGQGGAAEASDEVDFAQVGPFEVRHVGFAESLVEVGQRVEHLLAPEFGDG